MVKEKKPSSREQWQAMTAERQLGTEKDYITLESGTILYKHPIYKILPVLEKVDDETRLDFCLHVGYGDQLQTEGGTALKKSLYYSSENTGFSRSIKGIVDACLQLTSDGLVFNSTVITEKMDPDEVAMMRDPNEVTFNLDVWRQRNARAAASEARADRAARELKAPQQDVRVPFEAKANLKIVP